MLLRVMAKGTDFPEKYRTLSLLAVVCCLELHCSSLCTSLGATSGRKCELVIVKWGVFYDFVSN